MLAGNGNAALAGNGNAMLTGKRVVVTGATGGIGGAIARRCAALGAIVGVHTSHDLARARPLADELGGHALAFDVRDASAVTRELDRFALATGGLDGLVNNAGIHRAGLLIDAEEARIREQLDVNLLGPVLCARAALPHMLKARRGVIVNVGSVAAARPVRGGAVYAAAKGGLESFTRALAVEYAKKGIRAVCVQPGPIDTAMLTAARALGDDEAQNRTALRRLGTPEDVAAFVTFLLSDQAAFITGSSHPIDGGGP